MVKCGFFNAVKNHDGSYDRGYNAEDINKFFEGAMSENGIYKFVGNQCVVNAYNGMNVLVKDGKGAIKFHWFKLDTDEAVAITPSHPTLSRYTAIVARYDNSNRQIYLGTIDGEYEEIPSKPELIRSDSIYDLCLAYVYVEAGSTEITSENIQDTRGNEELCGFIKTLLDNGSGGGIPQVGHLPLPQASEIGKLYYLTVKDGDNEPGFYTCKRLTIYGYKDINMLSGVIADRPDPQFEFANQVYYATDELKYYVCKKNDESIYEWNEIEVTETSGLPTASIDTLNNYYLDTTDDTLHLGISEIGYGYAPFNGGGGNFAIIQISCPPGTNVRVSHNGEHQTKEVTDGIWLYGCIDVGEYVIAIPNTAISETIEITQKGQVKSIFIGQQTHNTKPYYLLGETVINETGDYAGSTTGNGYASGGQINSATFKSNLKVDFDGYKYIFINKYYAKGDIGSSINNISLIDTDGNSFLLNEENKSDAIFINILDTHKDNKKFINFYSQYRDWTDWARGTSCSPPSATKQATYLQCYAGQIAGGRVQSTLQIYAFVLCNDDNLNGLATYGSTEDEIIENMNALLSNIDAVTYLANICTGHFMLRLCSSTSFQTMLNLSENKDIILANEVWSKYINLPKFLS